MWRKQVTPSAKPKKTAVLTATMLGVMLFLLSSCTNLTCRTDACYDRQLAGVNPFEEGEIVAWGTEKEQAENEKRREKRSQHKEYRNKE